MIDNNYLLIDLILGNNIMDLCDKILNELNEMKCYDDFLLACTRLEYNECRSYILKISFFKDNENLLTQDIVMHIRNEVFLSKLFDMEIDSITAQNGMLNYIILNFIFIDQY